MTKDELERAILDLWLKTRIPLTRAHLQYHTGASRKKLGEWLDELSVEGVLDFEVTDDGDMLYKVPGATRPADGANSFAELEKLGKLKREVASKPKRIKRKKKRKSKEQSMDDDLADLQSDLVIGQARGLVKRAGKSLTNTEEGDKSLLLSSALSFFFGPLGWFYAGNFKEAAVGSLAYIALLSILPGILMSPLLFLAMPVSGIAGLVYAWQHNRTGGERKPLMLGKGEDDDSD
ncbi:MAG: hypothetical protein KJO07_06790 [Deltaproteobacteria bacterium]|nr:hypothetical protein [Deltaproteobacteria bacterium]